MKVRAVVDVWLAWEFDEIHITQGQERDGEDPIVQAYPDWFELAPTSLSDHLAAAKPAPKKGK